MPLAFLSELTSFVGREHELAVVSRLLVFEGVRLVTLVGPGGVGKTRLALRAVERLRPAFTGGVTLISLADLTDPDLVLPTIASAFGARDGEVSSLVDVLRDRHVLLVLDNLEHLLDAVAQLAELLSVCPRLGMLATSRVVLGLPGEHTVAVPPLAVPTGAAHDVAQIARVESVALFVQRARAIEPDFRLHTGNVASVARICERLDGLPLAIELIAVRLRHMPLAVLELRLDQRLSLLMDESRGRPDRQRSLRKTIAWSYELLSPEVRTLFRWLSVFSGGATLEAIEAVARTADGPDAMPFAGITALIDSSLLRRGETVDGQPRFEMLETIREFAREQLREYGEEEALGSAHAAYFFAMIESTWAVLAGPTPNRSLTGATKELGNLRATLAWVRNHDDPDVELRMVGAMLPLLASLGYNREGQEALTIALSRATSVDVTLRVQPLLGLNPMLAWIFGVPTGAIELVEEARAAFEAKGDMASAINAAVWLATVAFIQDDVTRALALYMGALKLCDEQHDRRRAAWVYCMLGTLHNLGTVDEPKPHDDRNRAEAYCRAALDVFSELGDRQGAVRALNGIAYVAYKRRDYGTALELYREAITLRLEINDVAMIVPSLYELADIAAQHGQAERSVRILGAAEALGESFGFPRTEVPVFRDEHAGKIARGRNALCEELGEQHVAAVWAIGRTLSMEQTIAEAMAVVLDPPLGPSAAASANQEAHFGLTSRERDVVRLIAKGYSNQKIADELFISVLTTKRHVSTILAKLNLPSRSALNTFAHEHRLS